MGPSDLESYNKISCDIYLVIACITLGGNSQWLLATLSTDVLYNFGITWHRSSNWRRVFDSIVTSTSIARFDFQ